jgi:hypothetical protein
VFTARYALSPYIKEIRFVFKGLIQQRASAWEAIIKLTKNIWVWTQLYRNWDIINLMMAYQAETCCLINAGLNNVLFDWIDCDSYCISAPHSYPLSLPNFKTPARHWSSRLRFQGLWCSINRYRLSACRNNLANESILAIKAIHWKRNHG